MLLSVSEVAVLLRAHHDTVHGWIRTGKLNVKRGRDGRIRIPIEEVQRFVAGDQVVGSRFEGGGEDRVVLRLRGDTERIKTTEVATASKAVEAGTQDP